MKVYILVYDENSNYRCGSDIEVYLDPAKARVDMAAQYERSEERRVGKEC